MIRKLSIKSLIVVLILIFVTVPGLAENRPVQLSLFTPIQLFPEEDTITGVRLNFIYGRNASVKGFDWGLVNHTTSGVTKGWQTGFVGYVESDFFGLQDNTVNVVKGKFQGLQLGIVNYAKSAKGIQFGFINYAEIMYGVQIGLVNIISQDGMFPVFPIVNWSF